MSRKSLAFAALLAGAALSLPAQTSSAASCWVTANPIYTAFTCHLNANATDHFIHVSAGSFATVDAVDWNNLVRVYHASAGIWGIEKTITGLYSTYYLATSAPSPTIVTLSNV